jgi:hypothetical protein
MRYLNKIVFINSAQVRYAEIDLNGNIHLIGTQGVGKSTLLRAILFFYNADTLGVGISKQKQSYTDYYYNVANSYIIYEVTRDEGKFCIVTYKSQHKVCFRFIDGEYSRGYFINKNGSVPESWEGIARHLDLANVYYTKRKIEEHKEYRDVLYGNNDGKKSELKRYSIIESREYQYIPKTIQNVFLNSKMDAEFIKQTIIMSLENDISIDLNQHTHHLNGFETQLADIRKFRMPGTSLQAENISRLYISIVNLEKDLALLAGELFGSLERDRKEEPVFLDELDRQKKIEDGFKQELIRLSETFKNKETKLNGDIRILDDRISKARSLRDEYEKKGINNIINRVEKKIAVEKEAGNLQEEKELLTSGFREVEQKYNALIETHRNQLYDFTNLKNSEKIKIRTVFLNHKDELTKTYAEQTEDIKFEAEKEIVALREELEKKKHETYELKIKKEGIRHKIYYEKEQSELEDALKNKEAYRLELSSENKSTLIENESLQRKWDFDLKELNANNEREKEEHRKIIEQLNKAIAEINGYLERSSKSFFGWLNSNYPGWETTIGKVIDDKNVLFNDSLSPKQAGKNGNLYGVEIDLEEINKKVLTLADYEKEKSALIEKKEEEKTIIDTLAANLGKNEENLKRKYQPKIRENKELIKNNEYLIQKTSAELSELDANHTLLKQKALSERTRDLEKIDDIIAAAVESERKVADSILKAEETLKKQIKSKERERNKTIELQKEKSDQLADLLDAEISLKKEETGSRICLLIAQKEKEFSEKGADTKRLNEIDSKLAILRNELDFIEQNRNLMAEYFLHKKELFDKLGEFKNQKLLTEKHLVTELRKFTGQKDKAEDGLKQVSGEISELEKKLESIRSDNEAFENFSKSSLYETIMENLKESPGIESKRSAKDVIKEIQEVYYGKIVKRYEELKKITNEFQAKFSDDNVFRFKTHLSDDKSYLDFAFMLNDFIEEKKIDKIEKEVNERFAFIISTLGTQANNLMARSGDIQRIIRKINEDFIEKNFVGVIRKIELKIEDSRNEIVQLLIAIKNFNDANLLELGESNLFSSDGQEKKNREAVDLLKQFSKKLGEMKKDYISLADSFELKFRIEENQNDTGWVEKLSNVGSDGTDVLVKAMVNIMLLNVFKEGASKKFRDFRLHCMMDEIGKLHPNNVRGILKFANDRNIWLINGSPIENDALAFTHIYKLDKDDKSITRVKRILSQYSGQ